MKKIMFFFYSRAKKIFRFFGLNLSRAWPITTNPLDFSETHLSECRVLPSRNHLLDVLPKDGVAIELGVASGDFSGEILKRMQPSRLYLVDGWSQPRYGLDKKLEVFHRFGQQIENGQVEVIQMLSHEAGSLFAEEFFDFVYIDTDHSYETTKLELDVYKQKVKPGGYICGDDYVVGNVRSSLPYGVIAAVSEFCQKEDWPLEYITLEPYRASSFAIRRPK